MVVPGIVLLYLPLGVAQIIQLRRDVDGRRLATLTVSSALMVPLGAVILREVDTATLQQGIGWLMIALALLLQMKPGPPVFAGVGAVRGRRPHRRFPGRQHFRVRPAAGAARG